MVAPPIRTHGTASDDLRGQSTCVTLASSGGTGTPPLRRWFDLIVRVEVDFNDVTIARLSTRGALIRHETMQNTE